VKACSNPHRLVEVVTLALLVSAVCSASEYPIRLRVEDSNGAQRELTIGVHPQATICVDTALGEFLLPPLPPTTIFDARIINPGPGEDGSCFDQGMWIDFRTYVQPSQVDTYLVQFQPGEFATSITLSWSPLNQFFSGPVTLQDQFGGVLLNVDMLAETSAVVTNFALNRLMILASGPTNSFAMASCNTFLPIEVGQNDVTLNGRAASGTQEVLVYFEWGTTTAYGNQTTPVPLAAGNVIPFDEYISGMNAQRTYHYRIVVDPIVGEAIYGEDQTFTTVANGLEGYTVVPIRMTNNHSATNRLWMGFSTIGSRCVDPNLGEFFLQAVPAPHQFDVRWIDPDTLQACFDLGLSVDIRSRYSPVQHDLFRLTFQAGTDGYPISLSWPNLNAYIFPPIRMMDANGGQLVNFDMMSGTQITISNRLLQN